MNATPSIFKALINIHKKDSPIKPIINWTYAPAYKLAKHPVYILEHYIHVSHFLSM